MAVSNAANAMIRTTTSISLIQGGTKLNVLPNKVVASIDHRVIPTDTVEGKSVLIFLRRHKKLTFFLL